MLKPVSHREFSRSNENMLQAYENAGLTPLDCMNDCMHAKAEVCWSEGYSDAALVGGIALTIAGIILKVLGKQESKRYAKSIGRRLDYAMQMKSLTDMAQSVVPGNDEDREDNND